MFSRLGVREALSVISGLFNRGDLERPVKLAASSSVASHGRKRIEVGRDDVTPS